MFFPILFLLATHFLGLIPLSLFNHISTAHLSLFFKIFTITTLPLPTILAFLIRAPTEQELSLLHCFTCMLLGMFFAALATVNYSLAYIVGALCSPLILVRLPSTSSLSSADQKTTTTTESGNTQPGNAKAGSSSTSSTSTPARNSLLRSGCYAVLALVLLATSPMVVVWVASSFVPGGLSEVLRMAAFGWTVYGLWTQVVVWLVWWPAWFASCYVLAAQAFCSKTA
jgi:glycosylphosphatidylinositol transamidase